MTDPRKVQFVTYDDGTTETFVAGEARPTDLSRLLDWYESVGIQPEVAEHDWPGRPTTIHLEVDGTDGHDGGRADFVFTPEGKFIRQDFWE